MNFVPGNNSDDRLTELKQSGQVVQVRITYPNLVTWEFLASVTGYEPSSPTDDRMTVTVTLTVSGSTTITVP
jgi:predicted secreted protein